LRKTSIATSIATTTTTTTHEHNTKIATFPSKTRSLAAHGNQTKQRVSPKSIHNNLHVLTLAQDTANFMLLAQGCSLDDSSNQIGCLLLLHLLLLLLLRMRTLPRFIHSFIHPSQDAWNIPSSSILSCPFNAVESMKRAEIILNPV
jgi:hypothetical protein